MSSHHTQILQYFIFMFSINILFCLKWKKTNAKGLTSLGLLGVNQGTNELYLQVTITETSLQKTGGKEG